MRKTFSLIIMLVVAFTIALPPQAAFAYDDEDEWLQKKIDRLEDQIRDLKRESRDSSNDDDVCDSYEYDKWKDFARIMNYRTDCNNYQRFLAGEPIRTTKSTQRYTPRYTPRYSSQSSSEPQVIIVNPRPRVKVKVIRERVIVYKKPRFHRNKNRRCHNRNRC